MLENNNDVMNNELLIGDIVKVKDVSVPLTIVALKGDERLTGSDFGGANEIYEDIIIAFDKSQIEEIIEKKSSKNNNI